MVRDDRSSDAIPAYVLPFVLYVVPTMFESSNGLGIPYELICTAKGLLAGGAFWMFRKAYPKFSARGMGSAIAAGIIGLILWIAIARLQSLFPSIPYLPQWLLPGTRAGFDPYADGGPSMSRIGFVIVRLIELAVIVPLIEEIFWRGFLARYLIAEDFQNVPQGTFTAASFAIVTVAFASVHPEILAAIAWCVLINILYWRTQNIWACVAMHATTNGLLGIYILATKSWNLW